MKTYSQLIIVLFVLLFESSYSLRPKKDKYTLPNIRYNKTNNHKNLDLRRPKVNNGPNKRYFIYRLKDLIKPGKGEKGDFLFFEVNSTYYTDISYVMVKEQITKINLDRDVNGKYKWFLPSASIKQIQKKFSKQVAIYVNRTDNYKESIIIRVNTYQKNENVSCRVLKEPSNFLKEKVATLKNQKKNHDWKNHKHEKPHHHDNKRKPKHDWKNHDWKNHGHNKTLKDNKFKKDYNQNKYRKNACRRCCFGFVLLTIWIFLFMLYFLVNRRKKTFVAQFKSQQQVNLVNYQNV
jgi:hypothetical protein